MPSSACLQKNSFPIATAMRGLLTMAAISLSSSASSCSGCAMRLIKPRAFASSALMNSPVTSISNATLRKTLRDSATPGAEQNRPRFTPLTANFAVLAATARSHIATSWQPAAVAIPWTRAITGTGNRWIASIMSEHCAKSCS